MTTLVDSATPWRSKVAVSCRAAVAVPAIATASRLGAMNMSDTERVGVFGSTGTNRQISGPVGVTVHGSIVDRRFADRQWSRREPKYLHRARISIMAGSSVRGFQESLTT